jgi:uncharacterized protein YdeI (YjbR/CyaY-like superfamily)
MSLKQTKPRTQTKQSKPTTQAKPAKPAGAKKPPAATPKAAPKAAPKTRIGEAPTLAFATRKAWQTWLEKHHAIAVGVWLQIPKKGTTVKSVSRPDALEVALCYGWIDGQARSLGASAWVQKFTPRRPKSIWSKINRDKVTALIDSGAMRPAGLAEIERAKQDGRWDAAYASPRNAVVPDDLQAALDGNPKAAAFFTTLTSQNRYAILFRLQTAKKADTRARRLEQFVRMLERHETIHPQ